MKNESQNEQKRAARVRELRDLIARAEAALDEGHNDRLAERLDVLCAELDALENGGAK